MMQAGKLQHSIELQRRGEIMTPSRKVQEVWTTYANGRAELRQASTSEFLTSYGEGVTNSAIFIIRWISGVSVADRIIHNGTVWNIVALAEIGRRRGLELRAVAA